MRNSSPIFFSFLAVLILSTSSFAQSKAVKRSVAAIDRNGPNKGEAIVGRVKNIIYPPLHTSNEVKGKVPKVPTTTVYDDIQALPKPNREELASIVNSEMSNPNNTGSDIQFWNTFGTIIDRCDHGARIGRTYGDPHIQTFDGYKYDLQSVGEFVLCRSLDGNFEIQTRQAPISDKASMNTACAINMVGDVVSVEAAPVHTLFNSIIKVNGKEMDIAESYLTPKGVLIKKEGNKIAVHSPIGEKVLITPISNGKYLTVVPTIVKGGGVEYEGLLGNADGNATNDLVANGEYITARPSFYTQEDLANGGKISSSTARAEKSNQRLLAKDFGDYWRITNETSLFTYERGRDTEWYTDLSYPRAYSTISDHDEASVRKAQENCKNAGVGSDDMQGCMLDVLLTGDPKAAEYSTVSTKDQVVKDLKINNPILTNTTKESSSKDIKAAKKEINKLDAREAWDNKVRAASKAPSQSNTNGRANNSSATNPAQKPSSVRTSSKPTQTNTRSKTVVRTPTKSVTRSAPANSAPSRSSSSKKTTKKK